MILAKQRYIYSALITLAFCTIILPLNERLAFTVPTERKGIIISYALKALFTVCLFFLVNFVLHFSKQLREGNKVYWTWLKYSAAYFLFMLIVLLVLYPGHWVLDELIILRGVKEYSLFAWQNYLTNIYYTFCLYLMPSGISIVIVQLTFCSLVIGYITAQFKNILKKKYLANFLFLLFFLPPIILNNVYPLRLTAYSYLELLLIARLLLIFTFNKKPLHPRGELIGLTTVITLLSFWRAEGLYYLLLFPILVPLLNLATPRSLRQPKTYIAIGCSILIMSVGHQITSYAHEDQYELTAFINPLSMMVHEPLRGENMDRRWEIIDKVVNVEVLKKYPSDEEIPAYWNGAVRPTFKESYPEFKRQYLYIILHNPDLFLKHRLHTFLATSGFGENPILNVGLINQKATLPSDQQQIVETFENTNYYMKPINPALKLHATELLLFRRAEGRMKAIGYPFWNVMLPILAILVTSLLKLLQRQYIWALAGILVLAKVPIVFLTAPANYFMYYLPVYISGYFLSLLAILLYLDQRRHKQKGQG